MARKQIDNYIFDYKKDNTVDFIAPDGLTLKLSKTEADYKYKRMWLAKNLDKLCFDTVKELGFTINNIYFEPVEVQQKFITLFKDKLEQCDICVLDKPLVAKKTGLKIAGSKIDIVRSYVEYLWQTPWKYNYKVHQGILVSWLLSNKNARLFIQVGGFGVEEIKENKFEFISNEVFHGRVVNLEDKISVYMDNKCNYKIVK